jgi:hypothetical protein
MSTELPSRPELPPAFDDHEPEPTGAFCLVEVALPLPITHAWAAYACRVAAIDKPRWHPLARVWRSRARTDDGTIETITISAGATPRTLRVMAEWSALPLPSAAPRAESETVRRVVSALFTGMQSALARRRDG